MKQEQIVAKKKSFKKVYKPRMGAPFKVEDTEAIGQFLSKNEGKTTAELLEIIKKDKTSAIYNYIEWDDERASELFRLQQIRNIVNHISIEIIPIGDSTPVEMAIAPILVDRGFHYVQYPEKNEKIIVTTETGLSNEMFRIQIIERAKTELRNWVNRYKVYSELARYVNALNSIFEDDEKD